VASILGNGFDLEFIVGCAITVSGVVATAWTAAIAVFRRRLQPLWGVAASAVASVIGALLVFEAFFAGLGDGDPPTHEPRIVVLAYGVSLGLAGPLAVMGAKRDSARMLACGWLAGPGCVALLMSVATLTS